MDGVFITSGSKENCQNWEKFQTPLGLRGKKFRFIIFAMGTTGSGKTDAIKYAKLYATLINPAAVRDNQFDDADGNKKKWIDIEVSHDHYYTNNNGYKDCINDVLTNHHNNKDDGTDIINNTEAQALIHDCYQQFRTGKSQTPNQKATRRAYGFSATKKQKNYTKPTQVIRRRDDANERKRKWGTSPLGKTLQDHELDKFVDTKYATNKRPEEVFNSDIVVYKKLTQAVKDGRNIVYESTGESFDTIKEIIKLASKACSSSRYNYIIMGVVNIIDKKSNIERIQTRFKSDLKKYKEKPNKNPAPKLSPINSEDGLEEHQDQIKQNIIKLIEYCTCKTKTIWQAKQDIGKIATEDSIFGENKQTVTTYQNYGDCDGVGIDLLMLFDQQNVDLREQKEKKENVYPSAIIPLSTRSQYLLPLNRTGEGAIVFSANEKRKARTLLGDICTEVAQPDSSPQKDMKKAAKTTDQLKAEAVRIEYRKKLRTKIQGARQGGKKTYKRSKNRTKRKIHKKKKTRKARKKKRKSRKRTRASVEKLEGFLKNFSKYDGNISKLKEIYK
jgi:hypothetical protein